MTILEHAREPALPASHVQNSPAGQIAEVIENQLDVVNAGIDGGREIFLVRGGVVEVLDDFLKRRRGGLPQ